MKLTAEERKNEWNLIYQERLGMLCGVLEPSKSDIAQAKQDADNHIKALESECSPSESQRTIA